MPTNFAIKGDVTAAEDMMVDFVLEGTLDLKGHRLTVADGAALNATVTAASVIIHGRLDGHISAERLEVGPTGAVQASIISPTLRLHDGGLLNGPVNTERAEAAGNVARHRQKA